MYAVCVCTTAGTDEKAIISVLAYRSNSQRQQIKIKFKSMFGKVCSLTLSASQPSRATGPLFLYCICPYVARLQHKQCRLAPQEFVAFTSACMLSSVRSLPLATNALHCTSIFICVYFIIVCVCSIILICERDRDSESVCLFVCMPV